MGGGGEGGVVGAQRRTPTISESLIFDLPLSKIFCSDSTILGVSLKHSPSENLRHFSRHS